MSCPPLDLSVTPAYRPAPYLISGPGAFLTADELALYFEDFYASLGCINTAPHLVFERLIGNLCVPVHAAIEKIRQNSANESSGAGITCPKEKVTAISLAVAPAPTNVGEAASSTKQHVIRSCTVPDNCTDTHYTEDFSTTGEVYLSRFAIALTSIRMAFGSLIASVSVSAPKVNRYNVALSINSPSGLGNGFKSASCSWLELNHQDLDMQCGVWGLQAQHWWDNKGCRCQIETCMIDNITNKIPFLFAYAEPPQVLVWLKRMHLGSTVPRSLRILVSGTTTLGFTLEVSCQSRAGIFELDISWLACSVGRPGVAMGTFPVKDQINAWPRCEGSVAFQSGRFKASPRVVVGFTGFEIDMGIPLCISVRVVEVTSEGMKWRIDGGEDDDRITAASGSFIAIE